MAYAVMARRTWHCADGKHFLRNAQNGLHLCFVQFPILRKGDEVFIQYIESKKPFIVEFYKKGECDNIRTLKFNVDIYEKLFKLMLSLELFYNLELMLQGWVKKLIMG